MRNSLRKCHFRVFFMCHKRLQLEAEHEGQRSTRCVKLLTFTGK
jgi:hypothetical protein